MGLKKSYTLHNQKRDKHVSDQIVKAVIKENSEASWDSFPMESGEGKPLFHSNTVKMKPNRNPRLNLSKNFATASKASISS